MVVAAQKKTLSFLVDDGFLLQDSVKNARKKKEAIYFWKERKRESEMTSAPTTPPLPGSDRCLFQS
jgi:hypothetical protein